MAWVLGVDGCPDGWIGALVSCDGNVEWRRFDHAATVVRSDVAAIGVDIPIGLADDADRECDITARRLLSPHGSRVFPSPVRAALGAQSYPQACEISRRRHVRRVALSRQTWNILAKIRQFDAVLSPGMQSHVVEVHPEVSFRRLRDAGPLAPKKSARGRHERRAAVRPWVAAVELPRWCRPDDALDALAVAWSARRWLLGDAEVLPHDDPPRDSRGLRMEIVV